MNILFRHGPAISLPACNASAEAFRRLAPIIPLDAAPTRKHSLRTVVMEYSHQKKIHRELDNLKFFAKIAGPLLGGALLSVVLPLVASPLLAVLIIGGATVVGGLLGFAGYQAVRAIYRPVLERYTRQASPLSGQIERMDRTTYYVQKLTQLYQREDKRGPRGLNALELLQQRELESLVMGP